MVRWRQMADSARDARRTSWALHDEPRGGEITWIAGASTRFAVNDPVADPARGDRKVAVREMISLARMIVVSGIGLCIEDERHRASVRGYSRNDASTFVVAYSGREASDPMGEAKGASGNLQVGGRLRARSRGFFQLRL